MTPKQAITTARAAVGLPVGSGTSWTVHGPYFRNLPLGSRTERHCSSYAQAVANRTQWVAEVALALLGVGLECEVYAGQDGNTVEQLVTVGLRRAYG